MKNIHVVFVLACPQTLLTTSCLQNEKFETRWKNVSEVVAMLNDWCREWEELGPFCIAPFQLKKRWKLNWTQRPQKVNFTHWLHVLLKKDIGKKLER